MGVYPRAKNSYLTFHADYLATSLSSITDGTSYDTTTTGAADAALLSTNENVIISIDADGTDICYGVPMYTVTKSGVLEKRPAYLIMTTNMTTIGITALQNEGWLPLDDASLYAEKGFDKEVDPLIPMKGDSFSWSCKLPIDSSAAASSSGFYFTMFMSDFQLGDSVRVGGLSSSVPTAYGMITEFGIDAIIYAKAFSTSSGCASGQILSWVMTTP